MIEVEPGDLLLAVNQTLNIVQAGQFLLATKNPFTALTNQLKSFPVSHAMIAIELPLKDDRTTLGIAHCTSGAGIIREKACDAKSSYLVYRVADKKEVGKAVNQVALTWTSGATGAYSTMLAAQPALHMSSYGSGAKSRAAFFEKHKQTTGGPPSGKGNARQAMFCSMFAIAVYQAAIGASQSAQLMALDAPFTSPMKLHSYVSGNKAWTCVGLG